MRGLVKEIRKDPTGDLSGRILALRADTSERMCSHSFHKEAGITPAQFVEATRIARAKMLLETSDWSLARIAARVGFGRLHALRRVFQKRLRIALGLYRDRFGGK
ncbi:MULTISPECIES: helix-turn-helix domain-containing protein, partial [unclassified Rhizobium]|jgi:transcriptional regulator GlxA family with amidase domain|uniref:helix-turn-helix domain-containing protein n=1 Tax=unclassified Rhizobium TaxID=2613769 RepID=UPI0006459409